MTVEKPVHISRHIKIHIELGWRENSYISNFIRWILFFAELKVSRMSLPRTTSKRTALELPQQTSTQSAAFLPAYLWQLRAAQVPLGIGTCRLNSCPQLLGMEPHHLEWPKHDFWTCQIFYALFFVCVCLSVYRFILFWQVCLFTQGFRPLPVICGVHCGSFPFPHFPPLPLSTAEMELWFHTPWGKAGKGVMQGIEYCHAKQGYAWRLNIPLPLKGKSCTTTSAQWLSLGHSAGENVTFQ